jgi:PAS domain S-box-containing protein
VSVRAGDLRPRAWWIAAGYAVVAIVWIVFSDALLGFAIRDPDLLVRYSSLKGIGFVVVTAVLLLVMIRRAFGRVATALLELESSEVELQRLGRLYTALTRINQAIVRRPARDELFAEACCCLVEDGGFAMAWIGEHDRSRHLLVPVVRHGDERGYLEDVVIRTDERPEGLGPSGTALREGRPYVCNDTWHDPAMAPWRDAVRRHGFRATASFPLRLDGETWGALNVYAREVGFFEEAEIGLLVEAAADLSYALDGIRRDAEREAAETLVREERRFSDTMLDSMPGILYFYDEEGRFLRWNRTFEQVSGYAGDEIAERDPLAFFPPSERRRVAATIAEVFEVGVASLEAPFLHRDGTATPYLLTGHRVRFEGRTCLIGVGIDITERKRAERALEELNDTLELKVAGRTDELRAALVRAEAADRTKSAFLATMSHELRTPLNSIIGFTGIVLQGLAGPLTAEQERQLGMVRGSARHLLALINDVLDLSRIEAGQLEVDTRPFAIGPVVRRAVATVSPMADAAGLTLDVELPPDTPPVAGDERRVEQILLNLLSNAVKFTERGGVTLTVDVPEGDRTLRLRVRDTGIGIAAADLAQLFRPFKQIDSGLARAHDGTGLGLAICRRLAELMGGTVTATSEPGVGSEFSLRLPAHDRATL